MALLIALTSGAAAASAAEFISTRPGTVSLDVKDEDVRVILQSMQKQCGIRNLLIDKDVSGKGMIYFREVPCATAFRIVMKQFGLAAQADPNVTAVEKRPR
jgi:type II secretory pathway component HofQ